MITITLAAAAVVALSLPLAKAQASAESGAAQDSAVKTPWGELDLQGIWTDETDTPLQRPRKYANQEFFTAAQREELDRERSALLRRDKRVDLFALVRAIVGDHTTRRADLCGCCSA